MNKIHCRLGVHSLICVYTLTLLHCMQDDTVSHSYNVVQYIKISYTLLRWQKQNIDNILNSQKTPHILPSRASYEVSTVSIVGENWPHYNDTTLYYNEPYYNCTETTDTDTGTRKTNPSVYLWKQIYDESCLFLEKIVSCFFINF